MMMSEPAVATSLASGEPALPNSSLTTAPLPLPSLGAVVPPGAIAASSAVAAALGVSTLGAGLGATGVPPPPPPAAQPPGKDTTDAIREMLARSREELIVPATVEKPPKVPQEKAVPAFRSMYVIGRPQPMASSPLARAAPTAAAVPSSLGVGSGGGVSSTPQSVL